MGNFWDDLRGTFKSTFGVGGDAGPELKRVGLTARLQLPNLLRWLPGGASIPGSVDSDSAGDMYVRKHNFSAVSEPTVNDDSASGYIPGSSWVDTLTGTVYVCVDASIGAAVWSVSSVTYISDLTKEPTGFENRTDTEILFDDVSRMFTVRPKAPATTFDYYRDGVKTTKTGAQTVFITDTMGLWFFYFDTSNVLVASQTVWELASHVPVASIYWNVTNQKAILQEERHGLTMDWGTHLYLHSCFGSQFAYGFEMTGYTLDTATNAAVQVGIANGMFRDEDIDNVISHNATPTLPFEQYLAHPAKVPVFYRGGSAGEWQKSTATNFPYLNTGTGRLAWNQWTGATWQQSEIANNEYMAYWIIATNSLYEPIISVQGQRTDGNQSLASQNNTLGSLNLAGLAFQEMVPLYRLIMRSSNGYANTPKCIISQVDDFRQVNGVPGGTFVPIAHSSLSGLLFDDHPQYFNENIPAEFASLTQKVPPIPADVLVIEDQAAVIPYSKKYTRFGDVPHSIWSNLLNDDHYQYSGIARNTYTVVKDIGEIYVKTNSSVFIPAFTVPYIPSTAPSGSGRPIWTISRVLAAFTNKDDAREAYIEVRDLKNGGAIVASGNITTAVGEGGIPQLVPLTITPANVPLVDTLLEVAIRRGTGGEAWLYGITIEQRRV